ncbi:MFS transporter permease [Microbulbifer flavimaris]|uniref:MFS transporter permease n=1 Tax=Microbulbifer flavimaris TaxID=1781068 RepID=A0ABX4HW88_9GAMM|nr:MULTISPECIES: DUF6064 family protein [Microbulbifer]KUJ80272.1 MFS transporter permease [Microbulbifer sp. ZGT114]PCO04336.1 MFS transporter permease [Microbulbifer flavimaris]
MNDWSSYRLQDFIPFTADIYLRLLERTSETLWPLHLLALAAGVAALVLALLHRKRLALLLVTPVWIFVGSAFLLQRYAELNWAGHYLGWAFWIEAGILALIGVTGPGLDGEAAGERQWWLFGLLIAALGLIAYPLIAPLAGYSRWQGEVFGIHPDPTALFTLGLLLHSLRGIALWLAAMIPLLWLVVSGLTLLALQLPWAIPLLFLTAMILIALGCKSATGSGEVQLSSDRNGHAID